MTTKEILSATVPIEKPQAPSNEETPKAAADAPQSPQSGDTGADDVVTNESKSEGAEQEISKIDETSSETPESTTDGEDVDFSEVLGRYTEELTKSGNLSDESRAKFASELGCDQAVSDLIVDGLRSRRSQRMESVLSAAGGSDAYTEMVSWASKSGYKDANSFNNAISSGSPTEIKAEVDKLRAAFVEANGSPKSEKSASIFRRSGATSAGASKASGGGAPQPGVTPFGSMSELIAAQKDSRYGSDPAYTATVYHRAAISKSF